MMGTSLDRPVALVAAACLCTLGFTVLRGDHVGVQIVHAAPSESAGRSSLVSVLFSETMNKQSVEQRFRLEPFVSGELSWSGPRLIFRPETVLDPGQRYTATIAAGAQSERGRDLLADYRFSFTVMGPRVAYLAPEDGQVRNIWIADPSGQRPAKQTTFSATGVTAFDVSPDGGRIVFAESKGGPKSELKLLDLESGEVRSLGNCGEWVCTNPAWSPDGTRIAYERYGYSAIQPGTWLSTAHVWLMDIVATPNVDRPLNGEGQAPPSLKPRWSPDGRELAVSQLPVPPDRNPGVFIYDLKNAATATASFPTTFSSMATFSPDGTRLLYPALVAHEGTVRTTLQVADLAGGEVVQLPGIEDQAQEALAGWTPDGKAAIVGLRTTGETTTLGRQLYRLDPDSGQLTPLLLDADWDHSSFSWDPSGNFLMVQRARVWRPESDQLTVDRRPEVLVLDPPSGQSRVIASNAFGPHWAP